MGETCHRPGEGDRPRFTTRPAAWAALALAFLGGNQWWTTAPKVAIGCWTVAGLSALWLIWRSLPPAPIEP